MSDKEGEIGVSEWERINTKARQGPTKKDSSGKGAGLDDRASSGLNTCYDIHVVHLLPNTKKNVNIFFKQREKTTVLNGIGMWNCPFQLDNCVYKGNSQLSESLIKSCMMPH